MTVKFLSTSHSLLIRHMLQRSFAEAHFCDVVLHFSSCRRTIRCHRSVLSSASPFLKSIFLDKINDGDDSVHLILPDFSYEDAITVLNLVYTGEMKVAQNQISTTSRIIELLHLQVNNKDSAKSNNNNNNNEEDKERETDKICLVCPEVSYQADKRVTTLKRTTKETKRPLLMKTTDSNTPMMLVLPQTTTTSSSLSSSTTTTIRRSSKEWKNSYQRAKSIDRHKFVCEECGRGFPLPCLLRRHKVIHRETKPFQCSYCDKQFTTKSSLQHHEFAKHLGEKKKRKVMLKPVSDLPFESKTKGGVVIKIDGKDPIDREVTVLDTSQTEMDTVIEVVETTSSPTEYITYNLRPLEPSHSTKTSDDQLYNIQDYRHEIIDHAQPNVQSDVSTSINKQMYWTVR